MMKYFVYKMHFPGGVRAGHGRLDEVKPTIYADTLFSALINECACIDRQALEQLITYTRQGQLRLTDAFPFIKEELYLPKPILFHEPAAAEETATIRNSKKLLKKIKYVSIDEWDNYLADNMDYDFMLELIQDLGASVVDTKIKQEESGEHKIYNVAYYRFKEQSGLYFILGTEADEVKTIFNRVFDSLSFTGIGGKKSIGLGRFAYSVADLPAELLTKINKQLKARSMLLTTSIYSAAEQGILKNTTYYYQLVRRGGFIYSDSTPLLNEDLRRKKDLYFFQAGSVFEKEYNGELIQLDQISSHPIYKYSLPIWMEV